jgi:protein O-mannosyl-transferase
MPSSARAVSKAVPPTAFWICLLLVALTLGVFQGIRNHEFVALDDPPYVTENPHVTGGLTWESVLWSLRLDNPTNWHPLTWISHMVDVELFGMNAGAHHLMSLLLHVANTVLLFLLLRRMTGALGRSAFVAALFAVHPLHVESVAWVAERKDVLSALFWMLTLLAYVGYVTAGISASGSRRARSGRYALVMLMLTLGLLAKPMLVTLPCVMLLLDIWPLGRWRLGAGATGPAAPPPFSWARTKWSTAVALILEKVPLFMLVAAASIITFIVQRQGGAMTAFQKYPRLLLFQNALVSYTTYILNMVWPAGLGMFYPLPASIPVWKVAGAATVLLVVSLAAIRAAHKRPYVTVGWFWYLGTLVPVIGLIQVGLQARADRYTYIPLIGLFIIVAWGAADLLARWRQSRRLLQVAAGIVILACAIAAHTQLQYWRNSTVLWARSIEVTLGLENARSYFNAGDLLRHEGKIEEAILQFSQAIRLDPDFAEAQYNLGLALMSRGRAAEAIPAFEATVRLQPQFAAGHINLGTALMTAGRPAEAVRVLTEAVRLDPHVAQAHRNLGLALANQGKIQDAIGPFTEAVRLQPGFVEAQCDLGVALMRSNRLAEAVDHLSQAVKLRPDFAEAHNDLGLALAMSGNASEALSHFAAAVRINPGLEAAHRNLAVASADAGRIEEAIREFQEVLRINPQNEEARRALASLTARPRKTE